MGVPDRNIEIHAYLDTNEQVGLILRIRWVVLRYRNSILNLINESKMDILKRSLLDLIRLPRFEMVIFERTGSKQSFGTEIDVLQAALGEKGLCWTEEEAAEYEKETHNGDVGSRVQLPLSPLGVRSVRFTTILFETSDIV